MTDEELEEIENREKAASPGPWLFTADEQYNEDDYWWRAWIEDSQGNEIANNIDDGRWDDGEFMAHAREDIPALIAEVRRLRAALKAVPQPQTNPD